MIAALVAAAVFPTATSVALPRPVGGVAVAGEGCQTAALNAARNGESSAGPADIGFPIEFFGRTYDSLFVNMDGNVTFGAPAIDYPSNGLSGPTGHPMIAPFLADVDTFPAASGLVHFGQTTFLGRKAFCVDWFTRNANGSETGVGYSERHVDKLNVFQLLLVQSPGPRPGDFDIVFNYDSIAWDASDPAGAGTGVQHCARAGYSDGSGRPGTSFQLVGSGECGSFLDSTVSAGLVNTTNRRLSEPNGRWVFSVRDGEPPLGGSIRGTVRDREGIPVAGAVVHACRVRDLARRATGGPCVVTATDGAGDYFAAPLPDGTYHMRAISAGFSHLPGGSDGVLRGGAALTGRDITLRLPKRLPPDVTLVVAGRKITGVAPVLSWGATTVIRKKNCPNGTGKWEITYTEPGNKPSNGILVEAPPGSGEYHGNLPRQHPNHGGFTMKLTIHCRNPKKIVVETFGGYIDPSGVVVDTNGALISGATVTLFRADDEFGPFVQVPGQDVIMSPSNRTNPDATDEVGHFGWDVIAGWYVVRAEYPGCTSPDDPSRGFVETPPLPIPPPVFDLVLVLECPTSTFSTKVRLSGARRFAGRVVSRSSSCVSGRGVILRRRQPGLDARMARTVAGPRGRFRFARLSLGPGRYYVGAPKRLLSSPGSEVVCTRGVSRIRSRS